MAKLNRKLITIRLELDDEHSAALRFRRPNHRAVYKRLYGINALVAERVKLLKDAGLSVERDVEELDKLSPEQMERYTEILRELVMLEAEYSQAILNSCFEVDGLELDGEQITVDAIRSQSIDADVAEAILTGYREAERVGADGKNRKPPASSAA